MQRRTASLLIALALVAFGVLRALDAITMLPGPASALLWLGFALQAVLAIVASVGVWRQLRWAPSALLLFGASLSVTALFEAFVLGILPWLYALGIAIAAIVIALLLGAYVSRSGLPE